MTTRLSSQLFLLGLIGLMGVIFTLTRAHPAQEMILSGAALLFIALSLLLERIFPLHDAWNQNQGDISGDIASFVMVFGVLDSLLKFLSPFLILALLPDLGMRLTAPLWQQVIAATLIIELGAWLSHWAHHRYPRLWALHAMHHSAERLYTLNNFRFHPLNHIFTHMLAFVPPLALGIDPLALLAYSALVMPILLFQHSNIRFDFGILNVALNTNAPHRWHHSTAPGEGTKNLGRAVLIWDHLFGTYYNPAPRREPNAVGLFRASRAYPKANRFVAQLLWPFHKDCCAPK